MLLKLVFFVLACVSSSLLMAQEIGLVMDNYFIDRWYQDQRFFEQRIKGLGGEVKIRVANGDPDEQVRICKDLIESGIKVLVVVPVDATKAIQIAILAKAANVPLISYDRLIPSNDVSLYISFDSEQVGELQARYALGKKPTGNYLIVNGPISDNNTWLIKKGHQNVLLSAIKKKNIKIIGEINLSDWGELGAMLQTEEFFKASKEIPDVIISANDALTNGILQILPTKMIGKVLITGQDADASAIKNIIEGKQAMTVYKPINQLAYLAAEAAMDLANQKTVKNKIKWKNEGIAIDAILLKPLLIDKSNYKDILNK